MTSPAITFTHALCRRPGPEIVDGLRAVDTGAPDLDRFNVDHAAYVEALRATGAMVTVLDPLPGFPDAVFIEDAALCLPEGAILMRPGAPSRMGEVASIGAALRAVYRSVETIETGHIEGGDILVTDREILVGTSARTDATGIEQLRRITGHWGYTVRVVETPPGVLHFKTDCSLVAQDTILATPRLSANCCFEGYNIIHTADGEEAAANAIRFNGSVIMAAGFAKTRARLEAAGLTVTEIGNTEAALLDGGMSCLSLRFSPSA